MARLSAGVDAACRPCVIEKIGGKRFALLHDFRDLLQIPIFGIGHRHLVAPLTARDFAGNQGEVPLCLFVGDNPRRP